MSPASHAFLDAVAAHRAGDAEHATVLYRQVPEDDPNFTGALFNLAVLLGSRNQLDEAEALYRRVLEATPDDADAWSNLGNLLQRRDRREDAEEHYRRALAVDPGLAAARVNLGLLCASSDRPAEAEEHYRAAVKVEPQLPAAHLNLGALLYSLGRMDEARACFERVLELDPDNPDGHCNLAGVLLAAGDSEAAALHAERALALRPQSAQALHQVGLVEAKHERHREAVETFRRALAIQPDRVESWQELGIALGQLEEHAEAEQALQAARRLAPDNAITEFNLGNLYLKMEKIDLAFAAYERACELAPEVPEILHGFAVGLHEKGRNEQALAIVERALAGLPNDAEMHNTRGICLASLGRHEEALDSYRRALALKPDFAIGYYNLGSSLRSLNRLDEACECFYQAIDLNPKLPSPHSGLGLVLQQQGRHAEAIEAFDAALAIKPDFGDALNNKAVSLQALRRFSEAVESYNRLIELYPDRGTTYFNLGGLLQLVERWDEATTVLKRGLQVDPGCAVIYPLLLHSLLQQCNWTNLDAILERTRENTEQELAADKHMSLTPFALQSLPGDFSMAFRQKVAEQTSAKIAQSVEQIRGTLNFARRGRPRDKKLKIGYISPDFRFHSVAVSFRGIIDNHRRDDFEFHAYSLHGGRTDNLNLHFRQVFDSFTDLFELPTREAAERIYADGIDILVDLAGHTRGTRHEILALRPAPIQVHYLGYTSTMGACFLDYLITDRHLVPPHHEPFYTEKLVFLPDSFMAGRHAEIALEMPSRAAEGLPEDGFVFANFNAHYKFEPRLFGVWMRLLRRVPGSVLWLIKGTPNSRENLRKEAAARGVAPERLVFAETVPHPQHLARLPYAGLALDNLYHGGGITTLDALWTGVPVLTIAGDTLPSRNGASLLPAVGMADLVVTDIQEYERLALALAKDPDQLAELRRRIATNRETWPLFDSVRLTRHLERAYRLMWEGHVDGRPPSSFDVPPLPREAADGRDA